MGEAVQLARELDWARVEREAVQLARELDRARVEMEADVQLALELDWARVEKLGEAVLGLDRVEVLAESVVGLERESDRVEVHLKRAETVVGLNGVEAELDSLWWHAGVVQ